MSELKEYTLDQVAKHTTTDSCWLVIGNDNNGECRPVDLCRRLFCRWRNLVFVFFVKQWQCKSHTNETTIGGIDPFGEGRMHACMLLPKEQGVGNDDDDFVEDDDGGATAQRH